MCNAGSQQEKEESTGQVLQDLAKQPESVLDPNRWYKILEVRSTTPHVVQKPSAFPTLPLPGCITSIQWRLGTRAHLQSLRCMKGDAIAIESRRPEMVPLLHTEC